MVINNTSTVEIGLNNISTNFKTKYGVGVCYFDPADEVLKEFTPSISIPIYPTEKSVRKFYIVKDDPSIIYNNVILTARTESDKYEVKLSVSETEDFSTIENGNTLIEFFSNFSSGIIPFNLYINNKSTSIDDVKLTIDMEIK